MDWAPKLLGVLVSGAQSNWWGIGCPSHCSVAGLPTLIVSFLLGLCLGILITLVLCVWGLGFLPAQPSWLSAVPHQGAAGPPDRARAYVNEQPLFPLKRGRRGTYCNLPLELQGLQITVRGSADRAASFVHRLAQETSLGEPAPSNLGGYTGQSRGSIPSSG